MISDIQFLYVSNKDLIKIDSYQIRLFCKILDNNNILYESWFDKLINQYNVHDIYDTFSVICGQYSYGGKLGLLELKFSDEDDVIGHLKATEAFELIQNHTTKT